MLQKRFQVGPLTVQRAVAELVARGLVVTRPGRGSFTAIRPPTPAGTGVDHSWQTLVLGRRDQLSPDLPRLIEPTPAGTLPLANAFLDETLQPISMIATAAARAARRPLTWNRQPVEGLPELRAYFAAELGAGIRTDQVLITAGGQSALTAAFRYLAEPGDRVVVESPTYGGAIAAARAAGLHIVPVPVDAEGTLPDALEYALERSGARLVYLQTRYANPTGAVLASTRRGSVLQTVARARAFVIEDDWVRDLHLTTPAPAPLAVLDEDGHVIHIRSLTKPMAAGVRVAALIARGPAFERLRLGWTSDNLFVAPILQQTALDVLTAPGWPRHLSIVRRALTERRDALLTALEQHAPDLQPVLIPTGGVLLWLRLPDNVPALPFAAACRQAGLAIEPGNWYFPGEPNGSYIRLSFAAAPTPLMNKAATLLAGVADDHSPGRSIRPGERPVRGSWRRMT
jgi:DNA-binding transcriptional MocR family regulator